MHPLVNLREGRVADLPMLWALRGDAIRRECPGFYAEELIEAWASVEMPAGLVDAVEQTEFIVADGPGGPQGFGFLELRLGKVEALFVAPTVARTGVGSALLLALEERASAAGVRRVALTASLNAERFYASRSYRVLARTTWQHPHGFALPCVEMAKHL